MPSPKPAATKSAFSEQEIEKIADLANLELSDSEKKRFGRQFADILSYFRKIEEVELVSEEAAPAESSAPAPGFREDRAVPSGLSPADFSPYLEDGHFKVPKVIE